MRADVDLLMLLSFASSLMLCGLIWTIQLVHYPSFMWISESSFQKFHAFHSKRITFVVAPLMVLELLTTTLLVFQDGSWVWIFNLILVVLIWLSTFLVSVPIHERLSKIRSELEILRLVATNWPRTILWSIRALVVTTWLLFDMSF